MRESLLPATAVTRINVARSGLKNSFHTAWTHCSRSVGAQSRRRIGHMISRGSTFGTVL